MKKGNIDDALKVLGFDIGSNGEYIYNKKPKKPYIEHLDDDTEEYIDEEEVSNEELEDENEDEEDTGDEDIQHGIDEVDAIKSDPEIIPSTDIKMIGENEDVSLSIEDALTILTDTLLGDKSILDVNDAYKLSNAAEIVSNKITEMAYKSNSDYVGKVRALENKIENYKKEFDKSKDLTKKLYLIAQAEERFFNHINEFGADPQVIMDMEKATASWHSYILNKTGIDLEEVRDIGIILNLLKERSIAENGSRK